LTPEKGPEWAEKFLAALGETGNVTTAATAAGVSRQACYLLRDRDELFASAWDSALETAADLLEAEARRRAADGVDEPVYYQGEVCGHVRRYSDTLLIFLLKAHRPAKFRDNARVEHSGEGGGPIRVATPEPAALGGALAILSRLGFVRPDGADPADHDPLLPAPADPPPDGVPAL